MSTQDERVRDLATLITNELPMSLFDADQKRIIRATIRPLITAAFQKEELIGFETAQNLLGEARKRLWK